MKGREEEEPPQIKTQGHKLALDGPDHITRRITPIGVLHKCQCVGHGFTRLQILDQKSRQLESGHRRHGVWMAIEYSYKLGQNELKFLCEHGWFL